MVLVAASAEYLLELLLDGINQWGMHDAMMGRQWVKVANLFNYLVVENRRDRDLGGEGRDLIAVIDKLYEIYSHLIVDRADSPLINHRWIKN